MTLPSESGRVARQASLLNRSELVPGGLSDQRRAD